MYVGVTNNLERRIYEHKHKLVQGFTQKYNVDKLVYFEETKDVHAALEREKEIKKCSLGVLGYGKTIIVKSYQTNEVNTVAKNKATIIMT